MPGRLLLLANAVVLPSVRGQDVKEKVFDAPNKVKIKVRMEGPYTADVPLQIVCYFQYTPEGAKRMSGAPVELDKRLGGVIASLRQRGEFATHRMQTRRSLRLTKSATAGSRHLILGMVVDVDGRCTASEERTP